jgi:hypothetical protein
VDFLHPHTGRECDDLIPCVTRIEDRDITARMQAVLSKASLRASIHVQARCLHTEMYEYKAEI